MIVKKQILTTCLLLLSAFSFAQQKFTEGVIVYDVTITGKIPTPANEPSMTETKSGTLTIYLKEENIRQDIKLQDGYSHSRIGNYISGKEIILQTINRLKYAIEISLKEQKKKNGDRYGAIIKDGKVVQTANKFEATEAIAEYVKGNVFTFSYLKTYYINHSEIFENTPELKGIPASYDVQMSNGFTTHFELKSITAEPVSNSTFKVPEGYRIISKKEYDKLLK